MIVSMSSDENDLDYEDGGPVYRLRSETMLRRGSGCGPAHRQTPQLDAHVSLADGRSASTAIRDALVHEAQ